MVKKLKGVRRSQTRKVGPIFAKYNFPIKLSIIGFLGVLIFSTLNSIFWLNGSITGNPLRDYVNLNLNLLYKFWIVVLIVIIGYWFLIFKWDNSKVEKVGRKESRKNPTSIIIRSGVVSFMILFIGFGLAIVSTFIIALVQLNLFAINIKSNPNSSNILYNIESITKKIHQFDNPPKIIQTTQNDIGKEVIKHYINKNTLSNFYTQDVLNKIPDYAVVRLDLPKSNLVLTDNVLFVNELNKDDLQKISPRIAYLLVKKYFSPRYIKNDPVIEVLVRQDYLKYREEQINDQLKTIGDYIGKVQQAIDYQYTIISDDKIQIALNQGYLASSQQDKDEDYNWCLSRGYYDYFSGNYIKSYSQDYCKSFASAKWDPLINQYKANFSGLNQQLQNDQSSLSYILNIKDLLDNRRIIIANQKNITPQELGIFHNQSKIKIALDWANSESIYNYLETLAHEYLHFTSYVSDKSTLPRAFEEGLTEYYARQIIKNELNRNIYLGYPVLVKVIQQMQARLPQKQLEDIYFNKDQSSLVALLNNTYGDKFYEKHDIDFAILPLLPNKDALDIANKIMNEIGGKQISEADLSADAAIEETNTTQTNPEDLVNTVKQFYNYIGLKQLDNAWNLLSKNFQNYAQGHDHFVSGYDTTLNVFIEDAYVKDLSTNTVYVKFKSADDFNGQTQYKNWAGVWQLIREDGTWKMDNANIALIK